MSDLYAAMLTQAQAQLSQTVQLRRTILRHPELGNELPRTRATVLEALQPLALDIRLSQSTGGVVAILQGAVSGSSILLRGDMDALPMPESTGLAFQTFVTRRFKPFDPVVLTVGRIAAGTVSNVIPEHAELQATLRTFSEAARELAHAGIRRLAGQLAAAHEMRAEVTIERGYPATYNDSAFVELVRRTATGLLGEDAYHEMPEPLMGAEDFSLILQRTPGAMAFLGVAPDGVEPGGAPPCHSNRMQLNESAMAHGVAMHTAVACDFLNEHA